MGVMLYTMLTGQMPFDRKKVSDKKFVENVCKAELKFPEGISLSSEVKDLIIHMLKKTVKERIKMSKIKEHPWFLNKKLKRYIFIHLYHIFY